jgi:hypothetical protein
MSSATGVCMRLIIILSILIAENLFAVEKKDLILCEGETTNYSFSFKTKKKRLAIAGANSVAGSCSYSTLRKPEVIQQMPKAIQSIASEKYDQNISAGECWQILSLLQIGGARCCFENTDGNHFESGQTTCEEKKTKKKLQVEIEEEDNTDYRFFGGYYYTSDFIEEGKQQIRDKEFCRKSEILLLFKKICTSVNTGIYFCEAPSEKYFLYLFEDEKSCRSQLAKKKSGYRAPEAPALLRPKK